MILLLIVFVTVGSLPALTQQQSDGKSEYICPMECKKLSFEQPGTCPICGMELVKKATFLKNDKRIKVAILLFDGVQIIDFSAPYEVFGQAGFKVVTVAEKKEPVTTSMNMTVTPDYDFRGVPAPDILVVPGGEIDRAMNNVPTVDWIKKSSVQAQYVLSVCNGAFLLARSGLLDGLSATTFYRLLDEFARVAPKTKVVRNQRFVDNGKIITTAGLTSGMDGSLHVISRIKGKGEAQKTALHLEYNWQPEGKFARAALADMNLPNMDIPNVTSSRFLRTEGTTDRWEMEVAITTGLPKKDLQNHIDTHLVATSNWKEIKSPANPDVKNWTFVDKEGKPWKAAVRIDDSKEGKNTFVVKVALNRV